jgi:beta-lactamase superfamily II metal-dependent hydrolase
MPAKPSTSKDQIRIRMYRVGFGDCFLLTLPGSDGSHHILIDCGVHARGNLGTIGPIVDDVLATTGKKLDIVIATHAHQDHISGFGTFAAKLSGCEVQEVWMPWTEDPSNKQAAKLKERQQALVQKLTDHFAALNDAHYQAAQAALVNLASNQTAFTLLRSGFRNAKVKYFQAGQELKNAAGVAGLSVKVLGPPTDETFLAKMDPPAGQHYLRLAGARTEVVDGVQPFDKHWKVKNKAAGPRLEERDQEALKSIAHDPTEGLAFALNQAINNTSLVTLFQYRGKTLLFAGDAQYGNWQAWLDQSDSAQILSQVDFFKVAHHGSVNATPKDALERMTTGHFAAMVSTQDVPWPSIPESKLLDALDRKASHCVVRSDSLAVSAPKAPQGPKLSKLPTGFQRGNLWFDYLMGVQ